MTTEKKPVLERLGLGQRLVKAWRLQWPVKAGRHGDGPECGLYIEPKYGIFYARVPETDEGTLYAGDTRPELRVQVKEALAAWVAEESDKELSGRVWERRIRIRYSGGREQTGKLITAEANGMWDKARRPTAVTPCTEVGVLTYSRYERSIQPDAQRYDEREWQEDYEARLARWTALTATQQDTTTGRRPMRERQTSWAPKNRTFQAYGKPKLRDVAWNEETWDQLGMFVMRFGQLHNALQDYLLYADETLFLDQLSTMSGRLLEMREAND